MHAVVVLAFCLFLWRIWLVRSRQKKTKVRMVCIVQVAGESFILEPNTMKKFSLSTAAILLSLSGLSLAGVQAAVDGAITVVSSDESVLKVTHQDDGLFRVDFIAPGKATLTASADADLTDGVKNIFSTWDIEIIDRALEADHFDFSIVRQIDRAPVDSAVASDNANTGTGAASDAAGTTASADAASQGDAAAASDTQSTGTGTAT